MKALVEFENVTKQFGNLVVLNDLSAKFFERETHVVCGRSGAGKSTLIRCINYLEPINSGCIWFKSICVNKQNARKIRKRVAMIFQDFNLFPHLTILENATLGSMKALRQPRKEAEQKAKQYFERVGLTEKINAYPCQLSGGQKQRAAIVRALNMDPDLILFDEPTSALDPEMIGEVLNVMENLAKEGRSMIVITHEMGFAKKAANRISLMDNGQLVETKLTTEFFDNPEHKSTRQFLSKIL
ncbi:Glutamine transport ATP-binding protein GlnQ [subsurface metagenome]